MKLLTRRDHICVVSTERYADVGVGAAAAASGLVRLLPSLEQRCPGLLDPGSTLEAAASHYDLSGLQAAWEAVGPRLHSSLQPRDMKGADDRYWGRIWDDRMDAAWEKIMAAAAGSSTPDAIAKMEWVVGAGWDACGLAYDAAGGTTEVWAAAAASGDLARLRWLREHGSHPTPWGNRPSALAGLLVRTDLDLIVRMEEEDGSSILPPAGHVSWSSEGVVEAAAGAAKDSVAKLLWLEQHGVVLGDVGAIESAALCGDLGALQLLWDRWRRQQHKQGHEQDQGPPDQDAAAQFDDAAAAAMSPKGTALAYAVASGDIPTAAWLLQEGCTWDGDTPFRTAFSRGDLPMVRWLLGAGGCPRGSLSLADVVHHWPYGTTADGYGLVEAVRLLAAAGWPAQEENGDHSLQCALRVGQPWPVWYALWELLQADGRELLFDGAAAAGTNGCGAVLADLVGAGVHEGYWGMVGRAWYAKAARSGDRGTLQCLRRLGVPMGEGALAEAVREGAPLPALKWLVEHGAPAGRSELHEALQHLESPFGFDVRHPELYGERAWLQGLVGSAGGSGLEQEGPGLLVNL